MAVLLREAIGDSIRRARTGRGRTLRDVSREARVSLGYLSEVERGRKEPSSELLAAICEALSMSLPDLLDDAAATMRPAPAVPTVPLSARRAVVDPALRSAVEEALGAGDDGAREAAVAPAAGDVTGPEGASALASDLTPTPDAPAGTDDPDGVVDGLTAGDVSDDVAPLTPGAVSLVARLPVTVAGGVGVAA